MSVKARLTRSMLPAASVIRMPSWDSNAMAAMLSSCSAFLRSVTSVVTPM
jgi:hypothetical protein